MEHKNLNTEETANSDLGAVMPSLHTWTDADIDAAYIMGAINADAVKADEGDVFPSLSKVKKELERLKELGFDRPYKALKAIRYPSNGA